jgi:hypothetical protein
MTQVVFEVEGQVGWTLVCLFSVATRDETLLYPSTLSTLLSSASGFPLAL